MSDFETAHALQLMRAHDTEALNAAFKRIPRVALLVIMDLSGMGRRRPPELGAEANGYENGMQALAVEILTRAGFDLPSILAASLTASLEGDEHGQPTSSGGGGVIVDDGNDEY